MKVKSFKVLPGVEFEGDDVTHLHNSAIVQTNANNVPQHLGDEANRKSFKHKYTFSLDGERYDPGHGWVFEVHEGLVRFVCDDRMRYRRSDLAERGGKPLNKRQAQVQVNPVPEQVRPGTSAGAPTAAARADTAAAVADLPPRPASAPGRAPTVGSLAILRGPTEPPPDQPSLVIRSESDAGDAVDGAILRVN